METVTITEMLRNPKGVIRKLDKTREVLIQRRDATPLRLSLSSRVEAEREGVALLARVLRKALQKRAELEDTVWEPIVDAYPWLRFLPKKERGVFLREFAETTEACAAFGNTGALSQLLHEWKATAKVYLDPALTKVLKRRSRGTRIRVPRPEFPH